MLNVVAEFVRADRIEVVDCGTMLQLSQLGPHVESLSGGLLDLLTVATFCSPGLG